MDTQKNNFYSLLASLLILMLLIPIISDVYGAQPTPWVTVLYVVLFGTLAWRPLRSRRAVNASLILFFAGVGSAILGEIGGNTLFSVTMLISLALFCAVCVYQIGRQVLFPHQISMNDIIGSICVYLFFGLIFALIDCLIYIADNDAFNGVSQQNPNQALLNFIYFSFVSLTTLGYGDISPVSYTAKTFATAKAVFGQFYIAILVAGLVAAHLNDAKDKTQEQKR